MEEVLRLRIMLYEENRRLPWKVIFRSLITVVCMIALGLNAGCYSKVYRKIQDEQSTGRNIGMMSASRDFPVNLPEISETAGMIFVRVPDIPDVPKAKMNLEESMLCEEENNASMQKTTAPQTEDKKKDVFKAVMEEKEDMPLVTDPAGRIEHTGKLIIGDNLGELDVPAEGGEVLEKEMRITVYGNGGIPEIYENTCEASSFSVDMLTAPKRMGKLFDKWYLDEECQIPFEQIRPGQKELVLYAGWMEFPGFISNDFGCITGCTPDAVVYGLICVPNYEECIGIEREAFDSVKDTVIEIYIPKNITYIAAGAFDSLSELMYIEVVSENPVYYSENGIVYYRDGTEAFRPEKRIKR